MKADPTPRRPPATRMTRRQLLGSAAATTAACVMPASVLRADDSSPPRPPRGALRVVHLTDWHLMNQRGADRGLHVALQHALAQEPIALLDTMTHTMSRPLAEVREDMSFVESLFDEVPGSIRCFHALGNHDVWGWDRDKSGATGEEPEYGKRWWAQRFGQGRTYGRSRLGRWHVVTLDPIQPRGAGYFTALDDEQFAWLSEELPRIPERDPVLVLTHAPIVGVGTLLSDARIDPRHGWALGPGHILMDAWRLIELFSRYPNVRLSLSGHKHICDRIEFQGMTHICGGAVCGRWWQPTAPRRDPQTGLVRPAFADRGYGLLDLMPDGRFNYRYVVFPWEFVQ